MRIFVHYAVSIAQMLCSVLHKVSNMEHSGKNHKEFEHEWSYHQNLSSFWRGFLSKEDQDMSEVSEDKEIS